jgi:hypothetical protein
MLADEYKPKIEAIIGDSFNYEGANEQISKWIDEGIIEEGSKYFEFTWTMFLDEPEFMGGVKNISWNPYADFYNQGFHWNVINVAWAALQLPNRRINRIWQKDRAVIVSCDELNDNGIPFGPEAWDCYYSFDDPGIAVKWGDLKQFVNNPDGYGFRDDVELRVGLGCEPYLYDVDIIFADGSSLHYDNKSIEK